MGSTPTTTTNRLVVEISSKFLIEYAVGAIIIAKKGVMSTSVVRIFQKDDIVVIDNNLVGIILDTNQANNNFKVKDVSGDVSTYNRRQIKLATTRDLENSLRQLLFSL